ncbi:hypothetical protein GCM10010517_36400 [Streptosporangium fragile]|uniref:Uncharacterized protein n=1 Tax=Streptosporangium fragile TaxID=46186 RepID=A0ABN3VYX8_9ACTN
MSQNLPASARWCPVSWCPIRHDDAPARFHRLNLGPFPGPTLEESAESAEIRVALLQDETDGDLDEPLVRISYTLYGRQRVMEVAPSDAADIGDLLTAVAGNRHQDLASTLVGVFWLTGGEV